MPKHDPLNPDSEQELFEQLSMTEEDKKWLDRTRELMKIVVKQENGRYAGQDDKSKLEF